MATKYTSNAKRVKYIMGELERSALKEIAKMLRKDAKSRIHNVTGTLAKNIGTWVRRNEGKMEIGVFTRDRAKKKGLTPAFHLHFLEFGTKNMNAKPFLVPAAKENIAQIRLIAGKHIKAIEDENIALGLIDEAEEISDD